MNEVILSNSDLLSICGFETDDCLCLRSGDPYFEKYYTEYHAHITDHLSYVCSLLNDLANNINAKETIQQAIVATSYALCIIKNKSLFPEYHGNTVASYGFFIVGKPEPVISIEIKHVLSQIIKIINPDFDSDKLFNLLRNAFQSVDNHSQVIKRTNKMDDKIVNGLEVTHLGLLKIEKAMAVFQESRIVMPPVAPQSTDSISLPLLISNSKSAEADATEPNHKANDTAEAMKILGSCGASEQIAYEQYLQAAKALGCNCTDKDAYDWCVNHIDGFDSKSRTFDSWARYLRTARNALGMQKNSSARPFLVEKSVVSVDGI